jgi:hypothetical protein
MKKGKRKITRLKMYGFNPFADQVASIDQLVAQSGENEATVLGKLLDEALSARRKKRADEALEGRADDKHSSADTLQMIERLLMKLVQQGDTNYRMQDISLALLQDTLAEARAGRKLVWKQMAPALKDQGLTTKDLAKKFDEETDEAEGFAYGKAQDYKKQQDR